jgi:hypothetical protein
LTKSQYALTVQKNNLKPDLRLIARLEPFGDGGTLTGNGTYLDATGSPQPFNAFRSLASGKLADYQVGFALNMPLGFRAEYAAIRAARLELTKSYLLLKDWENQVVFQVAKEFQELNHWYERIKTHRAERIGYGEAVRKKIEKVQAGTGIIGDPQFLESQRRYAAAVVKEYAAITEYNNNLARLEWAKGTIQRHNNVHISEGALPQFVQVRAVEYEKRRTKDLELRQRPDSLYHPGRLCGTKETEPLSMTEPPLEEPISMPKHVVPAKHEEKPASKQLAGTIPLMEEKLTPNKSDQILFKSAPALKSQPSFVPMPIPMLDATPLAPVPLPISSVQPLGANLSAPARAANRPESVGFITMDEPRSQPIR